MDREYEGEMGCLPKKIPTTPEGQKSATSVEEKPFIKKNCRSAVLTQASWTPGIIQNC